MARTISQKETKDELFYERCCGLDVHKNMIVACFRDGRKQTVKEFGTLSKDLRELAEWLNEKDCRMVAMESTGSYWQPVYNVLEILDVDAIVVNAHYLKNVPGRKTDVCDAEWIAKQLSAGNLRASFVPEREQRELRQITRYRKNLTEERAREINRLSKTLETANIKLTSVVNDVMGKSARKLISAAIDGEDISGETIGGLIVGSMAGKSAMLVDAMDGTMTKTHRMLLRAILDHIDDMTRRIQNLDNIITAEMTAYDKAIELLDTIPGIGRESAQTILAEIGLNMERFRTPEQLTKWAGVCPGNNESAGKRKGGRSSKGNMTLKATLVQSATSAVKVKNSFFRARYERLVVRRGVKRAKVAVAHSMLIAIWHMLTKGEVYSDLGGNFYNQFNTEKKIAMHLKKLAALGWEAPIQQPA